MTSLDKRSVCLIAVLILSACDDKQALTESQAKQTLQDYYDAHPVCTSLAIGFPTEIANVSSLKPQMDALSKAGLIAVSGTRYVATPAGESILHPGADKFLGGTDLCFAKRHVQKIDTLTVPADAMGVKISRVTYDYVLQDVAAWAGDPAMAAGFPQVGAMLGKPGGQAVDVLVQTSKGWKHERDTR